jgi:hypothetical protein
LEYRVDAGELRLSCKTAEVGGDAGFEYRLGDVSVKVLFEMSSMEEKYLCCFGGGRLCQSEWCKKHDDR